MFVLLLVVLVFVVVIVLVVVVVAVGEQLSLLALIATTIEEASHDKLHLR